MIGAVRQIDWNSCIGSNTSSSKRLQFIFEIFVFHFEELDFSSEVEYDLLFFVHLDHWLVLYVHRPCGIVESAH